MGIAKELGLDRISASERLALLDVPSQVEARHMITPHLLLAIVNRPIRGGTPPAY
jgi:hypothetical protein